MEPSVEAAHVESCEENPETQECQWTWQTIEAPEWRTLSLGPFEAGATCEILRAWYGVPGDASRQFNVTVFLRHAYDPKQGLHLSGFNRLFGDPAPLRMKRLCVEYRLRNVRSWDVSRGVYAEGGLAKLRIMPVILSKAVTNLFGAAFAASGYALGKAFVSLQGAAGYDKEVADSTAFQLGFAAWLRLNGIVPSVTYDPLPGNLPAVADDMRLTPLIVANHVCYLDGLVLAGVFGAPKIIAMKGTLNVPLLGMFAEELGVIEVDRSDSSSRTATKQAIQDHVDSWEPGHRPLLLFPEGTTSNGDSLLEFKKGAFIPGAPVRPVVLCYTGSWNPATTNFRTTSRGEIEATGDAEWVEQFLGHVMHSVQIRVLPPFIPNQAEKEDAGLFATNVRKAMRRAYEALCDEVAASREEADRNSLQAFARRGVEVVEDLTSSLIQSAHETAMALTPPLLAPSTRTSEVLNTDNSSGNSSQEEGMHGQTFRFTPQRPADVVQQKKPQREAQDVNGSAGIDKRLQIRNDSETE